eukprot:413151_1
MFNHYYCLFIGVISVLYCAVCDTTNNNDSTSLMQLTMDVANHCASYLTPSDFVYFALSCSSINRALQSQYPEQMICNMRQFVHDIYAIQLSFGKKHTQQSVDNTLSLYMHMHATRECDMNNRRGYQSMAQQYHHNAQFI